MIHQFNDCCLYTKEETLESETEVHRKESNVKIQAEISDASGGLPAVPTRGHQILHMHEVSGLSALIN